MWQRDRLSVRGIFVFHHAALALVVFGLQRDKLVQILVRLLSLFAQLHHLLHPHLICFILVQVGLIHILNLNFTLAPLNVLYH